MTPPETHIALLRRMRSLTSVLNRCEDVERGAHACLKGVCEHLDWPVGHLLVVSRETGNLVCG